MADTHQDRVVAITGAAGELGKHFAIALAKAGCHVAIADLNNADNVVAEIQGMGRQAYSQTCDLADAQQVKAFAASVLERFGRCDILVNNAAYMPLTSWRELTLAEFRKFEAINIEASLILAQQLAPSMIENNYGRIVQIASSSVSTPMPNFLAYITTKMAGIGLVRALAAEFGEKNIRVNALSPGLTRTPSSETNLPPQLFTSVREAQLIKRNEEPSDLLGALLFLTSEQCGFVTGQTLNCDGGISF